MIVDPRPHILWHQDQRRRIIEIRGPIDERFGDHLHSGAIDLGRRSLVIDLTDAALPEIALEHIVLLKERLGERRLSVRVRAEDAAAILAHDIDIAAPEP